jgi:hypothetical protein
MLRPQLFFVVKKSENILVPVKYPVLPIFGQHVNNLLKILNVKNV